MGYLQDYSALTDWNNAQAASGFENLPDGNYIASCDAVKLLQGDSAKNLSESLCYDFTVLDGEQKGRRFQHRRFISNAKAFCWIKKEMIELQVNIPQNPNDIALALQPAVGKVVSVRISNNLYNGKSYMNVYINGLSALPTGQTTVQPPKPVAQMQGQWQASGAIPGGFNPQAVSQPQAGQQAFVPNIHDDDIPF